MGQPLVSHKSCQFACERGNRKAQGSIAALKKKKKHTNKWEVFVADTVALHHRSAASCWMWGWNTHTYIVLDMAALQRCIISDVRTKHTHTHSFSAMLLHHRSTASCWMWGQNAWSHHSGSCILFSVPWVLSSSSFALCLWKKTSTKLEMALYNGCLNYISNSNLFQNM